MTYKVLSRVIRESVPCFGDMADIEAPTIEEARKLVAARVNGTVDGRIVRGPKEVMYWVYLPDET
jgi:hypothetical protein